MIHQFFSGLQAVTGSGPGPGSTMGMVSWFIPSSFQTSTLTGTVLTVLSVGFPVAHKTNE
jgi:hypothetical protein